MIFKVQISLNEPRQVLAYNQDRTREGIFPPTEDLLALMAGRPKAYFHANVAKDGKLMIDSEAPWQEW
jgi:hypothetical protein